ncbi:TIGR03032 family protein [Sphingomonas gilva]|uniref:TIGR03032 family protein n=2 Tax=Sphingomonas gilva TaxID=2305907 RepID=A0A396RND2_9SPHN|nr:TIGR03032 family protein [Sphingomonas gilva]
MLQADREAKPDDTSIAISGTLRNWLLDNETSLAMSSYQSGRLIVVGVGPDDRVSFNEQRYPRPTGLCLHQGSLFVAAMFQIWRLENILAQGQYANSAYDQYFVPRKSYTVNYVDTHELGIDKDNGILFVSSRYSCLATIDERHSFKPTWKPNFISALVAEDRCHLNGFALEDGEPKLATAIGQTDTAGGWRRQREKGGVLIDIPSKEIISDQLSMPHSPRIYGGKFWSLDSGRGWLVQVDPRTGRPEDIAFVPGFLRGLSFHNGYALVTASKAREGEFSGLPLQAEIDGRGERPTCGIFVIELSTGRTEMLIEFRGSTSELFDVIALPGCRNPASIGPSTVDMIGAVSFDPVEFPDT